MKDSRSLRVDGNELILLEYEFDQGPYRMEMYLKIVDEDYTATGRTTGILGAEFVSYLNRYFPGFEFLRTVQEFRSRRRNGGFYKIVRVALRFETDADAETAWQHAMKAGYRFNFQYQPASPVPKNG